MAHERVLATHEPAEDAGTTTLLGGVIVKLDAKVAPSDSVLLFGLTFFLKEPDPWGLFLASVGDVKCFVWRGGCMHEATLGNRGNVSDASDPGGRVRTLVFSHEPTDSPSDWPAHGAPAA